MRAVLLSLVNQLLDFRKNEMAGLHLTLSEGDIVAYVRSICASFLMLSEKKHVHLTFFSAMESLNMSFDEDKIGKVVMNLLSMPSNLPRTGDVWMWHWKCRKRCPEDC